MSSFLVCKMKALRSRSLRVTRVGGLCETKCQSFGCTLGPFPLPLVDSFWRFTNPQALVIISCAICMGVPDSMRRQRWGFRIEEAAEAADKIPCPCVGSFTGWLCESHFEFCTKHCGRKNMCCRHLTSLGMLCCRWLRRKRTAHPSKACAVPGLTLRRLYTYAACTVTSVTQRKEA